MKKNKFLSSFSALLCAGLLFFSCSDDFLNAPPQGALDAGTLANEAGVDASLISAYSLLDGWANSWGYVSPWPASGSNWIWGSVMSDDAHKGSEAGDQGLTEELELYQWQPGNSFFNDKFKIIYDGISRVNATINLANSVEGLDANFKQKVLAEAQFLRAHYHFEGYKMWQNIPYYDETDKEYRKSNQGDATVNLQADLEAAIAGLPLTQSQVGRATKGAAQSYLGKLLLFKGDFMGAKAQFDAVVGSGTYALSPCFKDIFSTAGENGSEMIFSYQNSVNDGTGGGDNGNFGDRLNFPHGGSPFGCCGFHQPTQNLVNAHRTDASGLPLFDTFNEGLLADGENVDPRLDLTVGRDGIPFLGHGTHEPAWIRARSFSGPFSPKKFSYEPGENSNVGWVSTQLSPINFPIIRYADVLLMLAEAEVELGNLERARTLVNMIRTRAGACAQGADGSITGITAADGAAVATNLVGTYDDAWSDASFARDAVRYERRIELALEGQRFFDLRRWGIAMQVMNKYMDEEAPRRTAYLTNAGRYQAKHDLYPLPTVQIELSKIDGEAMIVQNPGY